MNLTRSHSNYNDAPGLLFAGFNQDYGCFAIGLENGFRVFNSVPLIEQARNESDQGGIALIEMLYRTNYLALVGGGRNPRYSPNKVIIYDSIRGQAVLELEYKTEVKNVKLRRDRLIIVLSHKVFVYHFSLYPHLLQTFETTTNDKGLASISGSSENAILVIPGRQRGHIQLIDLNTLGHYWSSSPTTDGHSEQSADLDPTIPNISIIAAHSGKLSCIALNYDGTKCATASDKGTLIRVFNTATGTLLNELRRGVDRAYIFSIAFNHDSTRLCISSDKGTIHIFNLVKATAGGDQMVVMVPGASSSGLTHTGNRSSSLSFMKDVLPKYFSSEWSFAHAKTITESQCLVAFEQKHIILAICTDGSCYRFYFDPKKGGECTRKSFERFYKPNRV